MAVTLKDVARYANVSPKTVSRVVNGQGEIGQETRSRVQAAIKELGYRPNNLARSLVNQRSDTLAVVASGIEYFGPSRTILGIEQQADPSGYSMFLELLSHPEDLHLTRLFDDLIARRVEGIVWAIPEIGENRRWITNAELEQLPPIVFLSMSARPNLAIVAIDNRAGAKLAANHLMEQGRRRVGIITGPLTWWEARERLAGWQAALTAAGLPWDHEQIAEGDWSAASGERAMTRLLERAPGLDALFVSNDQMALGALGVLLRAGRCVPRDIALVGFDNIPESEFFSPPLTTIYQPLIEVGRVAMQELYTHIEAARLNKGQHNQRALPTRTVLIQPQLVVRQSSIAQPT